MESIDNIHWHDCELVSVVEIPSKDMLVLNVQYPEDWDQNHFVPKGIVFEGFYSHEVDEIPFDGNPTILSAALVEEVISPFQKDGYFKLHIETNAGDRFIVAESIKVVDAYVGI